MTGGIVGRRAAGGRSLVSPSSLSSLLMQLKSKPFKNSLSLLNGMDAVSSEAVLLRSIVNTRPKDEQTTSKPFDDFLSSKARPRSSRSLPLSILQNSSGKLSAIGERLMNFDGAFPQMPAVSTYQ